MVCEDCLHRFVCKCKENIMIPELEKIKAEINQQGSVHVRYRRIEDIDQLVDNIVYQCKDAFCDYIDNHIKELKGEQNEN